MKTLPRLLLLPLVALLPASLLAQNATTTPVGAVTITIAAGTGSAKKVTPISIPLVIPGELTGAMTGNITSVSANAITVEGAGWAADELSTPATPCAIAVTNASGDQHTFLISTATKNTATQVTIDTAELNLTALTSLVTAGDRFQILECDTLLSFFGTPADGVVGGTAISGADSIKIESNGSLSSYFYNTTTGAWVKVAPGSPNSNNVALAPNASVFYDRIGSAPHSYTVTGTVPSSERLVKVKSYGTTYYPQVYPGNATLSSLGLQSVAGWLASSSSSAADTVYIQTSAGGALQTFWFDGVNWRKIGPGSPVSDTQVIPAGSSVIISRKGSVTGSTYSNPTLPYSL